MGFATPLTAIVRLVSDCLCDSEAACFQRFCTNPIGLQRGFVRACNSTGPFFQFTLNQHKAGGRSVARSVEDTDELLEYALRAIPSRDSYPPDYALRLRMV